MDNDLKMYLTCQILLFHVVNIIFFFGAIKTQTIQISTFPCTR
jgi:hypothetical protein